LRDLKDILAKCHNSSSSSSGTLVKTTRRRRTTTCIVDFRMKTCLLSSLFESWCSRLYVQNAVFLRCTICTVLCIVCDRLDLPEPLAASGILHMAADEYVAARDDLRHICLYEGRHLHGIGTRNASQYN
jgi:hypothetical protein